MSLLPLTLFVLALRTGLTGVGLALLLAAIVTELTVGELR
jgi:hypothetical protein